MFELSLRKILSENKLEQETLDAQNAELERQRRLQELKKQQLAALLAVENEPKKEKDSQLKSLLQGNFQNLVLQLSYRNVLSKKYKLNFVNILNLSVHSNVANW